MVELKTSQEIAAMGVTGSFIAGLLDDLAGRAKPGVNLFFGESRLVEENPEGVSIHLDIHLILRDAVINNPDRFCFPFSENEFDAR